VSTNQEIFVKQEIIKKAIELIQSHPQGIRYTELTSALEKEFPTSNSIEHYILLLDKDSSYPIYKAARGLYRHTSFRDNELEPVEKQTIIPKEESPRLKEQDFYEPFAIWLKNDLGEVTKAIDLGGKRFKNKWGTPDVIGIYKSKSSDIVKRETEIVSAEIKLGSTNTDLITAFGQACAYKLFSHRVYLVLPKDSSDLPRIESLCLILGIGLIIFDKTNVKEPNWQIKCRAMKHEPDIWYVNDTMPEIEHELFV